MDRPAYWKAATTNPAICTVCGERIMRCRRKAAHTEIEAAYALYLDNQEAHEIERRRAQEAK